MTQYDCLDMTALENTAGPKGCLQYHLGDAAGAGRIDNFGFVGTGAPAMIGATVTHLQNQQYNICIRRHAAMTRICYEVAPAGTAMMADQGGFAVSTTTNAIAESSVDTVCKTDYITIPNGVAMGEANLAMAAFKFCGRMFNNQDAQMASAKVCSRAKPFVVGVNFDGSETIMNAGDAMMDEGTVLPTGHVGFHLTFTQDAM